MEVFYAATKGRKYSIKVVQTGDGLYDLSFYTHDKERGRACCYTRPDMINRVQKAISDSKRYDNINYQVLVNKLGV